MMNYLFNLFCETLALAGLVAPMIWELRNDRKGDDHLVLIGFGWTVSSKSLDVFIRACYMSGAAALATLLTSATYLDGLYMSGAIHFLFFDYVVAFILYKNGIISYDGRWGWFSYLGSKGIDNIKWWRDRNPWIRLAIRVAVFAGACYFYF